MLLLTFTLANCDVHDAQPLAVSYQIDKLKSIALAHCLGMNDDSCELTIGQWVFRHGTDWFATVDIDGKDSQEMYYTIAEVEHV